MLCTMSSSGLLVAFRTGEGENDTRSSMLVIFILYYCSSFLLSCIRDVPGICVELN